MKRDQSHALARIRHRCLAAILLSGFWFWISGEVARVLPTSLLLARKKQQVLQAVRAGLESQAPLGGVPYVNKG